MTVFLAEQSSGDIDVFAGHKWRRDEDDVPIGFRWIGTIHSEFGFYTVETVHWSGGIKHDEPRILGTAETFETALRILMDTFYERNSAEL